MRLIRGKKEISVWDWDSLDRPHLLYIRVQAEEIRAHNQQKGTDYKWVWWYFRGGISRNTSISFQWSLQVLTFSFQYLLYILLEKIYLERNHIYYIFLLNVNFKNLIVGLHIFIIFSMLVKFQQEQDKKSITISSIKYLNFKNKLLIK